MIRALLFLLLLPLQAAAQDIDAAPFRDRFAACLAQADSAEALRSCKDVVADACQSESEGGQSTLGITTCYQIEAALWDEALNADWPGHMARAKASDDAYGDRQNGVFARYAETLLAAQRAWIAWRDAECSLSYASWGDGSMRNIAASTCMAHLTADRVIGLREMTGAFR